MKGLAVSKRYVKNAKSCLDICQIIPYIVSCYFELHRRRCL